MPEPSSSTRAETGTALHVTMLGAFECRHRDEVIPRGAWRTTPTLTLFKLLLDERDRPVPVDRLIDAIWPDSDPPAARQSLQVAIRTLRLALEPDLVRGAASRFVKTVPGAYLFDSTECAIDVDLFLAASQRALAGRRRELEPTIAACHEAIAHYRGEYLADDPYSEWAFSTRERLRSRYLAVLDVLSASLAENGNWEQAAEWVERALELDPLREDLYRRLMRCHAVRGRRSHAIAVFERCRTALKLELSIEPSDETLALHAELKRQAPQGPARFVAVSDVKGRDTDLHIPFVGRARELGELVTAAERARGEAGILVGVTGPPGVGKSRLVEEFSRTVDIFPGGRSASPLSTVWVHCHEVERSVPFAPLARILAGWIERAPPLADRRRLEPFAPALARLVPQARALAAADDAIDGAFEIGQLLEAVTQAVRLMMRGGPGLLIVDDLQWADPSTVLWLSYVLHRSNAGMLSVIIYRAAEAVTPEIRHLLSECRRAGKLVDLALGPLPPGALEDLVGTAVGDARQRAELSRHVYRRTGGLPLYIVETLRDLATTGHLYIDDHGRWRADTGGLASDAEIPGDALQEIIRARLAVLDPGALRAFQALCVIGAECNARLVSTACEMPIESSLAALDVLLEHGLIRVGASGRSYVVEHPVVREVVYNDLGAGRQPEWHLRVARALREAGEDQPVSSRQELHHLIAAEAPLREIVTAAEAAGERAVQQTAISDAIECFDIALERLKLLPGGARDALDRIRISERRADGLAAAGRWDAAVESYERLIVVAERALDRARMMRKLAAVLGDVRGQFDKSLEMLDAAERELQSADSEGHRAATAAEFGHIESTRSNAHFYRSEYRLAIHHGERALERWVDLANLERDVIEQYVKLGHAAQRLGLLDRAGDHFRGAWARADIMGDRLIEIRCRDALAGLWNVQGRLNDAELVFRQTAAAGRELGISRLEIVGLANLAVTLCNRGLLGAARDTYDQALERAQDLDAQYTVMHVLVGLGEVLVRIGDHDQAREVLGRGIALADAINSTQRRGHAYLHLAELALFESDFDGAVEWAERGIATGSEIHDLHARREGLPILAQALIGLGRLEEGIDATRQGLAIASTSGFRLSEARNLLVLGEALAAAGCFPDSEAALATAEQITREIDARYDLARVLVARACCSSSARRRSELLDKARILAGAAPSRPLFERIEALRQI